MKLPLRMPQVVFLRKTLPVYPCVVAAVMAVVSARAADLTWDTSASAGVQSAAGTWNNQTTSNWTGDGGTSNVQWNNASLDNAIFTTTGSTYTVTLAAPISVTNISFAGSGAGQIVLAASQLTFGGSLDLTSSNNVSIGSQLSGAGSITSSGALTFTNGIAGTPNNFTGGMTLNAGSVTTLGGANLNTSFGSGTLTLNGGIINANLFTAGYDIANAMVFGGDFALNSTGGNGFFSGTVNLGGATRTIINNGGGNTSLSGLISNGGIIIAGSGGLNISNTGSTFSGGVTLTAGSKLSIRGSSTGPVGALTSGPLGTGTFTINGGSLQVGNGTAATLANNIVINNDFALSFNSYTFSGAVDLGGGNRTITMQGTNGGPFSGVITNGGIILAGSSAPITLNNVNSTFSGGVTLGSANTLSVSNSSVGTVGAITSGPLGTGTLTINGGSLSISNSTTILNAVVVNAGFNVTPGSSNSIIQGAMDIGSGIRAVNVNSSFASGILNLNNIISGTGGFVFTNTSTSGGGPYVSTVSFGGTGANTYTGLTTLAGTTNANGTTAALNLNKTAGVNAIAGDLLITGGKVSYGASNQIADTSAVTVNGASAIFDLGASRSDTVGTVTLDGGGSITGTGTSALTGSSYQVKNGSVSAILAGSGVALTKSTSGTVTLTRATNTYTGATAVNGGTLVEDFNTATASASGATALANNISTSSALQLGGGTMTVQGRVNGTTTTTGAVATWANGSTTISLSSAVTGLAPGQLVTATGLPAGAYIVSIAADNKSFVISANTTAVQATATTVAATANSFTSSQTFASTAINAGASSVIANVNSGTSTTINLGAITRNAGGTVDFRASTGTFGTTAVVNSTAANDASGILGAWATVNGGADFAANNGSNKIIAYTGYTDIAATGSTITDGTATNVRLNSTGGGGNVALGTATTNINTLMQNTATAGTVDTSAGTLRTGTAGGVFITPTGADLTIGTAANAGVLTAGGSTADVAGELILGNNSASTLTINSTVTNNGTGIVGVTKTGTGLAVLNGANTYTGTTYINSGILNTGVADVAGVSGALGNGGAITFGGGTLQYSAASASTDYSSRIVGSAAAIVIDTNGQNVGFSSALGSTNSGGLTKSGTGTLTLSGANAYTGATTVSAGTLKAGVASVANVSGAFGNNSAVSLANASGVILDITGFNTQIGSLTGGGTTGGNVTLDAATLTTGGDNSSPAAYAGVISGTGGLNKIGTGTQILSGANTYTGATTVNGGKLQAGVATVANVSGAFGINSAVTLGNTDGAVLDLNGFNTQIGSLTGGGTTGGNVTLGSATLTLGADNTSPAAFAGAISGTGGLTKIGTGTAIFLGTNIYSGATTISAGALQLGNGGTTGSLYVSGTIANNGTLIIKRSNAVVQGVDFSSAAISGTGSFIQAGTGSTTLNALNSYSGTTTVSSGTLIAGYSVVSASASAFGNSSSAIVMGDANTTANNSSASLLTGNALVSIGRAVTIANQATSGTYTIGGGTAYVSSFTGAITANQSFTVSQVSGGTLNISGNIGSGNATAKTVTFNNAGAVNVTSVISNASGTFGLTQSGAGTTTLSGANTYTGATNVLAGTLALGSNGSLASTNYAIADGATFNASAKTSYSLAAVATTIGVGATTSGFFNGPTGALTLGNSLTLNFSTSLISDGQTYNLFDFGSKSGNFSSIGLTGSIVGSLLLTSTDTWTGAAGGYDFTFNQATGNLLVATSSVPEPSTYALLLGGAGLTAALIRRRRR
ncbi:MAG: autotransporter-associated beta strand repeat-containing protein [Rariglobus sp.]|nr:autotransporter-associated beta strand repeat-containing protein [Rariglobus sp.]